MKTYKIHLIRHGLTQANIDAIYCGHTDTPLSEMGKEQVLQAKANFIYPEVDFVFSSPLSRCTETAKLIYPNYEPVPIDDMIEYNFGSFEGMSAEQLTKNQPYFEPWLAGVPDVKPPFGESHEEFSKRICTGFSKIVEGMLKTNSDNIALVTHGGVIMTILARFGLPEAPAHEWLTPSGCGYTIRITPSLWMSGKKFEVIEEIPHEPKTGGNYYDGWDYYPDDDDFDVSEYVQAHCVRRSNK